MRRPLQARAEGSDAQRQQAAAELENPDSEAARKKAEADRLRAAEKFMMVGTGEAECKGEVKEQRVAFIFGTPASRT